MQKVKSRILKRPRPGGHSYVIQFRHRILFWIWRDAWEFLGEHVDDRFDSLNKAKAALPLFEHARSQKSFVIYPVAEKKEDYTEDPRFWKRLRSFSEGVYVSDLPGMEERDMIVEVCDRKIRLMEGDV
jgi:hypothetical protein